MSAHVDTFARDHLPPRDEWPEFLFTLPELRYPETLNCAAELLDATVARGLGERPAIVTSQRRVTYAELLAETNRIAHVLRDELGLVPGNRLLLRGFNNDVMAACWLAAVKAGLVVVTTMPLLRAKELIEVIGAAEVTHALCDARLLDDLDAARPACPTLREVVLTHTDAPDGLGARMARQSAAPFTPVATASDDVCMIAFTSGTTGRPKGTMHFHRDVLAIVRHLPALVVRAHARRRVRRHAAAGVHLRPGRRAAVPAPRRRLDAAAGEADARNAAGRDRAARRDGPLHRADLVPRDDAARPPRSDPQLAGVRLGRRVAAGRHAHRLGERDRRAHHRRHRLDRDAAHLHRRGR